VACQRTGALVTTVHTSGINWESVSVIGGFVIAAMTFLMLLMERRNTQIKNDITSSVNNLGTILEAKLETKQTVAGISERLARIEGVIGDRL
jgi:hypothetical protein